MAFYILIGLLALGLVTLALALPLYIVAQPFIPSSTRDFDAGYRDFLALNEGRSFFVYTNKRKPLSFIVQRVLPELPPQIRIVYLEGRTIRTELGHNFISRMLYYDTRARGGFPWLIKISAGKPIVKSINRQLYKAMKHDAPQLISAEAVAFLS